MEMKYNDYEECNEALNSLIEEYKCRTSEFAGFFNSLSTFELLSECIMHYANEFAIDNYNRIEFKGYLISNLKNSLESVYLDFLDEFCDLFHDDYFPTLEEIALMYKYNEEINTLIEKTVKQFKEVYSFFSDEEVFKYAAQNFRIKYIQ